MHFAKKKHKQVQSKAEACSLCKLTKIVPHPSKKDVIWVNKNTEIGDARRFIFHNEIRQLP